MLNLRPVLFVLGCLLTALGVAMLVPLVVEAAIGAGDWVVFAGSAGITIFVGGALVLANRGGAATFGLREGFLLTTLIWSSLAGFAALPFLFAGLGIGFADAVFEAVSGITTTGATVLAGLDTMPPGILIWRALLQWLGGIGILVMAIVLLPFLRVGGMQLFRTESSDRSDKALPTLRDVAAVTFAVYLTLSALCALLYWAAGMTPFDAIAHMMSTVATGGYSTKDASIGHFDSAAIHWIAITFMILGALPFMLYIRTVTGEWGALWYNTQVQWFLGFLAFLIVVMTSWLVLARDETPLAALTLAAFNLTSVLTTTGYASSDYSAWGEFPIVLFFLILFVGGCAGSTSGGIKVLRFEVMAKILDTQVRRLIHPRGVFPLAYGGRPITADIQISVIGFVALFIATFVVGAAILGMLGLDFVTAISGSAAAITNVGPGLGPVIGPAGSFASLPDAAKWVLAVQMMLGRLELFTVFVLLMPSFWRG